MPAPVRTVLVPDLEHDLAQRFRGLEEFLLVFAGAEPDDFDGVPEPIAGDTALEAVRRLWQSIKPSQHDDRGHGGRLLAPDGRYEHIPLAPVELQVEDVAILGATARALAGASSDLREAMVSTAGLGDWASTPTQLVEGAARLHGMLDLELTGDARTLIPKLHALAEGDVVLTVEEEDAYRRTADRINAMWTGSGLDRWAY